MPKDKLDTLSREILTLKKQLNAVILAHYYQEGEIQDIADQASSAYTKEFLLSIGDAERRTLKQVDEALLGVDAGLAMPGFHPHFTLGRLDENHDTKAIAHLLEQHQAWEGPPFRVEEFHLLASEVTAGRPPAYRSVRTFPL